MRRCVLTALTMPFLSTMTMTLLPREHDFASDLFMSFLVVIAFIFISAPTHTTT
jgi:hypothetical protein